MQNKLINPGTETYNTGIFFLVVSLLLLPLMISHQSLWIDEAYNAQFARLSTFKDFLHLFLADNRSENQMPFGMFYSWVGGQIFGSSEWSLRAINLLWCALGTLAFYRIGKIFRIPWLPLCFVSQPFLWLYMNEARPYAMQIGSGALLLLSLIEMEEKPEKEHLWLPSFMLGSVVLCASSLLGTIPFVCILAVMLLIAVKKKYYPSNVAWWSLAILFIVLLLLAAFYIWTLAREAKGAKIWPVGISNLLFAFYDLLGFGGLGPPRSELREAARQGMGSALNLLVRSAPAIIALVLLYAVLGMVFLRKKIYRQFSVRASLIIVEGSFLILMLASILMSFPFWGRHLAVLLPFMIFPMGLAANALTTIRPLYCKILLACLGGILLTSSLKLRFSPSYAKDNYRAAADYAKSGLKDGKTVWWAADPATAAYYNLPFTANKYSPKTAVLVRGSNPVELAKQAPPDLLILSKPDIFDADGELAKFIHKNSFVQIQKLQSFTIWGNPVRDQ